ncbi:hypothetical protein [Corallococcus exiguus]|uniref:Uncharacterized protein n=1 Tax=Corallococcus exiguus TaxID=83462 RepID=A0A7X5BSS2_9BACT|nr:hypothetical protein [Corallococcus exiguus]NBC40453.1 hypothetical protein [Corallococcus exiguus]TNV64063.1 hypothetical protein FH620_13575 [Corallococcus exiguus]
MKKRLTLAAGLAALLTAPTALAQASTGATADTSIQTVLMSAAVTAVPIVAAALATLISAALYALTKKLNAQAGDSKLAQVGARVSMLAESTVRELEVTMRPKLEAAAADGVLTAEELAKIKTEALTQLKASLGEHGLKELQAVLGLTAGSIGTFLGGLIEAAVDRMKAGKATPSTTIAEEVVSAAQALGAIGSTAALAPATAVPSMPCG